MKAQNHQMKKIIRLTILMFTTPWILKAQDIQVTRITGDVIVLHPRVVNDISIMRRVGGNVVAVRTDSGIVVIDSFTSPEMGNDARDLIRNHFPNLPIKYLINTHHHSDHIGGNASFGDACIIGHKNMMDHGAIPLSIQISSNAFLKLGGKTFEILHFGTAHTNNDLVVLDREDRLLVMGDLLCYRKCYIMNPESDAINWIRLLDTLISRSDEYDFVIPGHCEIALHVDALIEQHDYLSGLCDAVKLARLRNLSLEQAKEAIRLEQYQTYMMYERLGDDIEAYWKQSEKEIGKVQQ